MSVVVRIVHAGDLVVADDDGVVVVPRSRAEEVLAAKGLVYIDEEGGQGDPAR